jgi:photosystem II stability/assembly factor-like uncharacterized protein
MKRLYLIILIISTVITTVGFRGCQLGYIFFYQILYSAAYGATPGFSPTGNTFGIAVGENGDIFTQDGSPTSGWTQQTSPVTEDLNYNKIYIINDPITYFAGAVGNNGTVIWSTDKGLTWEDHSFATLNRENKEVSINFYGFDFLSYTYSEVYPVVCGDAGKIYKSTDGGGGNWNWQEVSTITSNRLNSIGAITSDLFIAVGEKGTIIRTSDGGTTWEDKSISDTSIYLNKILISTFYPSFERGWIVGTQGKIYRTTDYGNSWISTESGTTNDLNCISFRSPDDGVIAGDNGTVRYTIDGGLEWLEDNYFNGITSNDIVSMARVDSNTANALVRGGTAGNRPGSDTTYIYVVSSEPLSEAEDEVNSIPSEFKLQQNYPNPFNPGTVIGYQLPLSGLVSLKIYDILGNEVAILVNGEKSAGVYEVEFNAGKFPTGIYICVLESKSRSETIKMLLLK